MSKTTFAAAVLAASLSAGGAAFAGEAGGAVAEPWEASRAPSLALAARAPIVPGGPSSFALGVAALAGVGFLRWRRRRYIALTAAL